MSITIVPKSKQGWGAFNGGEIKENKPLGFPQDGGELKPYSNLFYWAHAWAEVTSTLAQHPHQGFEIMSFILKGDIEHFDNKHKKWIKLRAGDAQIIRSGRGISHSERFHEGSEIFQIWMDPNLTRTLDQEASYDDYPSDTFPVEIKNGVRIKIYRGENAPIRMDTENLTIKEYLFNKGTHQIVVKPEQYFSAYLIEGQLEVEGKNMNKDDFMVVKERTKLNVNSIGESRLFVIESPQKLSHPTYVELVKQQMGS